MTIEEFFKKWHWGSTTAEGTKTLITRFSLSPDGNTLSPPDYSSTTWRAECTVQIRDPSQLKVEFGKTDATGDGPTEESSLDSLDKDLTYWQAETFRLSQANRRFSKPIAVVLLGAGFSAGFGFPITNGLGTKTKRISTLFPSADEAEFRRAQRNYPLQEFCRRAKRRHIPDMEYLITTWSGYLAQLEESDPNRAATALREYNAYLMNVACHLLHQGATFLNKPANLNRFNRLTAWLKKALDSWDIRFHTFNYDLLPERLIISAGSNFTYLQTHCDSVPIRKPHGSLNWIGPLQGVSVPNHKLVCSFTQGSYHASTNLNNLSSHIWSLQPPVIIPPNANKTYQGLFDMTWRFSRGDLEMAKKVLIIGYSFPPLDYSAAHYLSQATDWSKKEVLYVNSSPEGVRRAKALLRLGKSQTIQKRWRLSHFSKFIS